MKDEKYSLRRMRRAIARSCIETDKFTQGTIWPIHPSYLARILSAPFAKDFNDDFQNLKKDIGLKALAKVFVHPSALWLIIMRTMPGLKIIGLEKEKRAIFAKDILKMIDFLMVGNIYCEDKKNIVWDNSQIDKIFNSNLLFSPKDNFPMLFGRLHADLMNFSQSVFWVTNCAHREIHGPYPCRWNNQAVNLVIREYFLLNPEDLVKDLRNFPLESLTTYSLYKPKVKFEFAVLNDYANDLPLSENLVAVGGQAKYLGELKKLKDEKLLTKLCQLLEKRNKEISERVNKLSEKEKAIGLIFRSYYLIKNMRKQFDKSWIPPKDLIEKVKKEGIQKALPPKGTTKQKAQRFLDLYDPRVGWEK